jgi:hypothetical protein
MRLNRKIWSKQCGGSIIQFEMRILVFEIPDDAQSPDTQYFWLWSNDQSYRLQILRPGFDSLHYQKKSSGSGTGSTQPREYN